MKKEEYEFVRMPLKKILTVLIDHCMSFETLRNMTVLELSEAIERVNSGELLSFAEKKKRKKAEIDAARAAYRKAKK